MQELIYDGPTTMKQEEEMPAVRLFQELLLKGYETGASDIHLEPMETILQVRMRIDGVLKCHCRLEKSIYLPLMTCAKIRSGMDIEEKRLPQDGHCRIMVSGTELNLRAGTMPTIYGEKMVLRYLNRNTAVDRIDTFGMDTFHYEKMSALLKRPGGIIYFTGPTGSGKTTTLYMILEKMAEEAKNIMTIEDPVEKMIPGIIQSQINNQSGLTFETGLRAILRQDPDVIMIGETRDSQTAKIAVRAAIAGNLVLSTLHTRNAAAAVSRMIDLGVEPYMAAECLNGVVSQRLAKKVCTACAEDVPVSEAERKILGIKRKTVRQGKGCPVCNGTGYKGRIAVHEILAVDRHMRRMIAEKKSSEELFEYARTAQNMCSLRENMVHLVELGITTIDEVLRLTDAE